MGIAQGGRCLVTGGHGFIGSHLVEGLLQAGYRVRVLDNASTGTRNNTLAQRQQKLEIIPGDVRHLPTLMQAMAGCQAVFHQAAVASVSQSMSDPVQTHDINVNGTLNVLEAARQQGVSHVVLASSAAVYGDHPEAIKTEQSPVKPVSLYGLSKLVGEQYAELYSAAYGLKVTCLRYFNVFGPRQNPASDYSGVIARFVAKLHAGLPITIFGDGLQSRDFVHVADIVQANLRAIQRQRAAFRIYNVATGISRSILEIVKTLQPVVSQPVCLDFAPERRGDIRHSLGDNSLIRTELGFVPRVSFEAGLREYFHQSAPEPVAPPVDSLVS